MKRGSVQNASLIASGLARLTNDFRWRSLPWNQANVKVLKDSQKQHVNLYSIDQAEWHGSFGTIWFRFV